MIFFHDYFFLQNNKTIYKYTKLTKERLNKNI